MNQQKSFPWLAVLLIGGGAWLYSGGKLPGFSLPDATIAKPAPESLADNFVAAFVVNEDRAEATVHAHAFATICTAFADMVAYDQTKPQPRLKRGVQLDDARLALRESTMKGFSFNEKYPKLHGILDAYLSEQLGTSGGELTPEQIAKWIAAYKTLAACSEYASKKG